MTHAKVPGRLPLDASDVEPARITPGDWATIDPGTEIIGRDGQRYEVLSVAPLPGAPEDPAGRPMFWSVTIITPWSVDHDVVVEDTRVCLVATRGPLSEAAAVLLAAFPHLERIS